jgi:hypothetical protein
MYQARLSSAMDLLKTLVESDFSKQNLWIWTGGTYTKEGYFIPVCIDVIENIKMAELLYFKRKNERISVYRWFPK